MGPRGVGNPPQSSLPPPRPPDSSQFKLKLQTHKEEVAARFNKLGQSMTAFAVEQEEFQRELKEELRQLRLSYGEPLLPQPHSNPPMTTISTPLPSSSVDPRPSASFTLPQVVANPTHTQIVNATTPSQFIPQIHHSPNVTPLKMKLKFERVHQKIRIHPLVTLKRKLWWKFSHQKQSQTSGDSKTTWVDHRVRYRVCKSKKQLFGRYYHHVYKPAKFVSEICISRKCGSVSGIMLCLALVYEWSRNGRKLNLKHKCTNEDYNEAFETMLRGKFDKAFRENDESMSLGLVQCERRGSNFLLGLLMRGFKRADYNFVRLQLQGLFNEGLHKSMLVSVGDMYSMDFSFEVFPSLPCTYHNWRAILNWFVAAVVQCSIDPYMFIDNILLGDIGGRVSLQFGFKMERKTRTVEKMFDIIWQRWKSQIISGTLIIEIFVKELNVEFFGNYMKLGWFLLNIHHIPLFRNGLLLLTAPAKDIHVLQEFKGFHFYWVPEVMHFALFLYWNLQEFISFYLLHQELIYGGHQLSECRLEIPSNVTYGITVRYKRLLQFLSQYLRMLALICGPYEETIEISFAEFSKTSEPGTVIHIRELLTTREYQAIVSLQLGHCLSKGLLFSCIVVVGKVSHMSRQLGSRNLDDNIGWTYWQKQVDQHGREVIGNSRDQFNNAYYSVKWVRVVHICNQPSNSFIAALAFLVQDNSGCINNGELEESRKEFGHICDEWIKEVCQGVFDIIGTSKEQRLYSPLLGQHKKHYGDMCFSILLQIHIILIPFLIGNAWPFNALSFAFHLRTCKPIEQVMLVDYALAICMKERLNSTLSFNIYTAMLPKEFYIGSNFGAMEVMVLKNTLLWDKVLTGETLIKSFSVHNFSSEALVVNCEMINYSLQLGINPCTVTDNFSFKEPEMENLYELIIDDLYNLIGQHCNMFLWGISASVKPDLKLLFRVAKNFKTTRNLLYNVLYEVLGITTITLQDRDSLLALLKQNLHMAQERMKLFHDKRHTAMKFEVGNPVYLKLQSYKQQSVKKRTMHKLLAEYYGPYEEIERIGTVAKRKGQVSAKRVIQWIGALVEDVTGMGNLLKTSWQGIRILNLEEVLQLKLEDKLFFKAGRVVRDQNYWTNTD